MNVCFKIFEQKNRKQKRIILFSKNFYFNYYCCLDEANLCCLAHDLCYTEGIV